MHAAGEVEQALSRNAAGWRARAPSAPVPARDWLLVFVGDDADEMRAAAAGAAAAGFERGAVLEGGLQGYGQAALQQVWWYTSASTLDILQCQVSPSCRA